LPSNEDGKGWPIATILFDPENQKTPVRRPAFFALPSGDYEKLLKRSPPIGECGRPTN